MERAAVFDVDGTLVDTNHLHVTTWWEAFRQAGHPVSMHAIHRSIGLGSTDLITHLLGDNLEDDEVEALSAAHKALYGTYFDRLPAFEDAGRLLKALDAAGWTVVLATSAGGSELSALRRAIDADDAIRATASADDVEAGKPAPEPVQHALDLVGIPPERAVFVGDTVWDMRAGTRAGVTCVGVLCGGIPRASLEDAGADTVYRDPVHLLTSLEEGNGPLGRKRAEPTG
ncbi:HAD family hydrolase [Streptomyces sp. NBC_00670]|jgi:phosphoglycolate phosphatase-like HAD superfamily hydrolase|uniref:HAD family hydrolase n=1 Tax=Streptomyces sp. NBC_00670 TaxID=2975804 RepID=UPI002E34397D|nr:HAD family hydrolase [Streptomyces sp. NBC_00670]